MPEAVLRIDLGAIAANLAILRHAAGGAEVAGMVKADAYGLGAAGVAPVLWAGGCRSFFAAKLGEALALREVLPGAAIYVLEGIARAEIPDFLAHGLRPVLNHPGELALWAEAARRQERRLAAAIQLETGLCRLGMTEADLALLDPAWLEAIDLTLVMSHLACADEPGRPENARQRARFVAMAERLPAAPRSFANSSGIFLGRAYRFDQVRPGAALYGINPLPGKPNPMHHVVSVTAPVLRVQRLDAPGGVGYGATHLASKGARIATIGVGYADGFMRAAGNAAMATIGGRLVPVVGRVSMDLLTLDVSELPEDAVGIGTPALLFGPGFDLDAVAASAGTIGYELLTRLGGRFRRVYEGGAGQ